MKIKRKQNKGKLQSIQTNFATQNSKRFPLKWRMLRCENDDNDNDNRKANARVRETKRSAVCTFQMLYTSLKWH